MSRPTLEEIEEVREEAEEAFWQVVATKFPSSPTGDYPPEADMSFKARCQEAIELWVDINY